MEVKRIANLMKASINTVMFVVLLGVVWGFVATEMADTHIPAAQQGIILLVGIVFTLGGTWMIARSFGMGGGHGRPTRR